MTENKQEPTFELHDWFDGGDIFFRSKDKKRLAQAVVEIVENDLSVALIARCGWLFTGSIFTSHHREPVNAF
jgi:hypothetical protein